MLYKLVFYIQAKPTRGLLLTDWLFGEDYEALKAEGERRLKLNPEYVVYLQTLSCTATERL